LRDLGLNLGEGVIGVVIQLEVDGNRADSLRAGRLHVVDAIGARDDPFKRSCNEPTYEVRIRTDIRGRDLDDGDIAPRVLAHAERPDRLQPGDQNHQVDDDRQHWPLDKEIREFH
jgi:hypothetical protein